MAAVLEQSTRAARPRPAHVPDTEARAARWAITGLFFINGLLFATWVSRIPVVQVARGLNNGTLGLALLAIAMGALIAMPATGWCLGRFGSRRVTQVAALLYAASLPLLAFAPGMVAFVAALFCFGVSHGSCDVAMNAQAIEIERRYQRSIMSSFHAFFSLGGLAGAALGGLLAARQLPVPVQFVGTSLVVAVALAIWTLPWLLSASTQADRKEPRETAPGFKRPSGILVALGTVAICVMMGEGAMADWSAIYLRRVLNSSDGIAALGYAAFSVAMAVGRLSGDWVAATIGPVKVVRFGGLTAAAGLLLAIGGQHPALALLGFACVGIGFAAVVPLVFSAAGRVPGVAANVALSSVTTLGYLGFLIGPPLIGVVSQWLGLRSGFAVVLGTSLLAATLASSVGPKPGVTKLRS